MGYAVATRNAVATEHCHCDGPWIGLAVSTIALSIKAMTGNWAVSRRCPGT